MALFINAWIWTMVIGAVIVGTPLVAIVWAVTAPFDPGRYAAGRMFRLVGVLTVKLNPLWHFETAGAFVRDPAAPVRRGQQPRVVRRHLPHLPPAVGDEVDVEGDAVPDSVHGLDDADGRRHPGRAGRAVERDQGARRGARSHRQARQRHDLPRRHALARQRAAPVQGRRLSRGHRDGRADPAARRRRHPARDGEGELPVPEGARAREGAGARSRRPASRSTTSARCATGCARSSRTRTRGCCGSSRAANRRDRLRSAAPRSGASQHRRELAETWQARDLLFTFADRDIRLRYRQTALGVVWVVLQPLIAAGIFTFVFGTVAHLSSDGKPYLLFTFAALTGWNLFSGILTPRLGLPGGQRDAWCRACSSRG